MKLAQISDFHYTTLCFNPFRLFPKRIFSHIHWLLHRKDEFSTNQLESLPSLFEELNVDLVLLGGDFTSSALPNEFSLAKHFVDKISKPFIAIPGNHDFYTFASKRNNTYYQYFKNKTSSTVSLLEHGLEAQKISPHWWVISLNTAAPRLFSSKGLFTIKLSEELEKILQSLPDKDNVILFNHYPFLEQEDPKRGLEGSDLLEQLIRRNPKIRLYLQGHTHRSCIADLRGCGLPIILDSGSCGNKKNGSWNLIDLEDTKCRITPYQWQSAWKKKETKEFIWKTQ
jgi:3',5'-cyclic AMP phosphodiesterase CpdA